MVCKNGASDQQIALTTRVKVRRPTRRGYSSVPSIILSNATIAVFRYLTRVPCTFVRMRIPQIILGRQVDIFKSFKLTNLVKVLCELPVNHRNIPASAFKLMTGKHGNKYYKVSYELELHFGTELSFKLVHQGRVIGSVTANYH